MTYDAVDNNLTDGVCADLAGKCTLRAAIQQANQNSDHDTIRVKPGTYTLALAGIGENAAATGDLDILNPVTMIGVMADGVTENPDAAGVTIDAAQIDRVISVGPYSSSAAFDATLRNLTLTNGKNTNTAAEDAYGGALDWASTGASTLTIENVVIKNSYATTIGGGMFLAGGSGRHVIIRNTIVTGNSTPGNGGGIAFDLNAKYDIYDSVIEKNTATYGAGLYSGNGPADNYVITISGTTFEGNTATNLGGGLNIIGPVNMVNSTISGNKSTNSRAGGMAIGVPSASPFTNTLRHVTVTGNTAAAQGGGIEASDGRAVLTLHNSIVAGNTGTGGYSDFYGTGVAGGTALIGTESSYNIVGGGSNLTTANGNKIGVNPDLKALANNGGLGRTHEPNLTSPAKDAGNNSQVGGLTTDQRGNSRIYNGTVDIGAVEWTPPPTTTTLTSSANPSTAGQSVTFTATVNGNSPTGTVQFKSDGTNIGGPVTLTGGVATYTTSSLAVGAHTITATYSGNATNGSSTGTVTQTVNKAASSTAVSGSPSPAVHGQQVTLTATVTSGYAGTISGSIQFKDGGSNLGTPVTLSGGSASWSGTLSVGSHTITAVFSGDGTYNGSTSPSFTQTVNKAATSVTLQSSKNPSLYNQEVMFTAQVTVTAPGVGTPSGTVTFKDGATVIGTPQNVSGGYATIKTSSLSAGTHSITAVYNGDGNLESSTSSALSQEVQNATTTTTVTTSMSPSAKGESVTFTATVSDSVAGSNATGQVTFKYGTTLLGNATLDAEGKATYSTTALPIGTHTITAEYPGDTTFLASSGTTTQVVDKGVTSVAIVPSDAAPVHGQDITATVTVTPAVVENGTPTGTFTIKLDGVDLSGTFNAPTASVSLNDLTKGDHTISATYGGDATFAGSSATYNLTVGQASTATSLAAAPNPSEYGEEVTFTATVSVTGSGAGTPTGNIVFTEGSNTLATVPLTGTSAVFKTSSLAPGEHKVTASYTGDGNFTVSGSGEYAHQVNKAASTVTLTSSKAATVYGEAVTLTATITSGFGTPNDGTVTFIKDGTTSVGTATVVSGKAILAGKTDLPIGTYSLTAVLSDSTYAANGTSGAVSQTVTKAPTTVSLDVDPAGGSSVSGQFISLTAWVEWPHAGTPTGTITFFDGDTELATETINAIALASFGSDQLAPGAHNFKAVYSGDDYFGGNASDVSSHSVGAASTGVVLNISPATSRYGETVTYTATVAVEAPGSGTPIGEVIFRDQETSVEVSRVPLTGGTATWTSTTIPVGTHKLVAEFLSDTPASYAGGTSAEVSHTVNQGLTTTTLVGLPNPSVYGETVTLKATVTANIAGSGTPSGQVNFYLGATLLGDAGLNASGVAELTYAFNQLGTVSLTAEYVGSTTYAASTSTAVSQTINKADTTTVLTADPTSPTFGDTVTLTATVAAKAPGGGTPAGKVTFKDGETVLASDIDLDVNGQATFTTAALGGGTHSLTAVYAPSPAGNHTASTSAALSLPVAKATVTAVLTATDTPWIYGGGMHYDVSLTPTAPATATPTGQFDLVIDDVVVATHLITGTATGTYNDTTYAVGPHTIRFIYKGSNDYATATSGTVTESIIKANSTTSADPIAATVYGQTMTFPVKASADSPSQSKPSGTVQILDDMGTVLGETTLVPASGPDAATDGSVTLTKSLPPGTHTLTVKYLGDSGFNGSTATVSHTVNQADSAALIDASTNTIKFGETVRITATINAAGAGSGTPTQTVHFVATRGADTFDLGTATLAAQPAPMTGAQAYVDVSTLPVGDYLIKAEYGGDDHFKPSDSGPMDLSVQPATTGITLAVSPASPLYSQEVTITATVAPTVAPGIPTGKVTFKEGATVLAADVALNAEGKAEFKSSSLALGGHDITASYAGEGNYDSSTTAAPLTVTVVSSPTATALESDSAANTTTFGETLKLTATITSTGGGTPGGSVTFKDGATVLDTVALSGGKATLSTAALGGGVHNLTAVYNGSAVGYLTSTSAQLTHTVNKASVTAVITALENPSVFGQSISFDIAVTPVSPATVTPTGDISVDIDEADHPGGFLVGGVSNLELDWLTVGDHTFTLNYLGDANYAAADSTTITQTVEMASVTVTIGQDASETVFGQDVTLSAMVSPASPSQARPSGKVQFMNGTELLGEVNLAAEGFNAAKATLTTKVLAVGTPTVTVKYLGDDGFNAKTSDGLTHTVVKADTAVALASSLNPSKYGETVTLTATVAAKSPGSGTPTGTVTFKSGSDVIGTGSLSDGAATLAIATLAAKSHTITAEYSGDGSFNGSATGTGDELTQVVHPGTTSTAVTSDVAAPVWGQSVTFSAQVTPSIASGTPGGTVTFKDGAATLATGVALDGSGKATFTTDDLTVGNHTITAIYDGAGNYAGSTSADFAITVGKASSESTLTVAPTAHFGDSVTFSVEVSAKAPGAGLPTGTVTFEDGTTELVTGLALDGSGAASYTVPAGLTTGAHTITVTYSGDGHFTGSTADKTHTVLQADGNLSFADVSAAYGSTATLRATLLPPAKDKVITFTVAGKAAGTAPTNAAGVAETTFPAFLTAGDHNVTVSFAGDADIAAVTTNTGKLTVTKADGTVTVAAKSGTYRSDLTLEATLSPAAANRTITFSVNGTEVGTGTTDATGKATYPYFITAPVGTATIGAAFTDAADAEVGTASSTGTLTIGQATGAMVVENASGLLRRDVTLKATLTPAEAGLSVTFKVGAGDVGTDTTDENGVATVTYTLGSAKASQTITAVFAGNANIAGATGTAALTTIDTKPQFGTVSGRTNLEGESVDFIVAATDEDGDTLSYSMTGAPEGVAIDSSTGRILGTIEGNAASATAYQVTVTATDAFASPTVPADDAASITFAWTVNDDLEAPSWPTTAEVQVSNETDTGLKLTWAADATDNVKVTEYRIFKDGSYVGKTFGTTYNVTGLTKNTWYTFTVEAADLAGNVSSNGPSVQGLTALGAPDLSATASQPLLLKAGETITVSFPGQPNVTATYSLAYEQSMDGTTWTTGTPMTGSLTAGAGEMPTYSGTFTVPANVGIWRNLAVTVTATDRTAADTTATKSLTYLVDTIHPAVDAAETGAVRPLKGGESFTVSVTSEAGLGAASVKIGDTDYTLTPVAATPTKYEYTYHVGATENRTVSPVVTLTDAAGNVTEQTLTPAVVLDNTVPAITSVTLVSPGRVRDGKAYYIKGESLTVEVVTEPGLTQTSGRPQDVAIQIPGAAMNGLSGGWLHLTETGSGTGIYRGTYVIQEGDSTGATPGHLETTVSDLAGNVNNLAGTEAVVVDTVMPDVTGIDHDARTVIPTGGKVRLTAWAEPNLYAVTYEFTLEGGKVREGTLTQVPTSPGYYEAFYTVQPGDTTPAGGVPVYITLEDVSGNKETRQVTHTLHVDTAPPVMGAISVTPASPLEPGQTLTIRFTGETGLQATVTVGTLLTNEPMVEDPAGTYTFTYTVKKGDEAVGAAVSVMARDQAGNPRLVTAADTVTLRPAPPVVNVGLNREPDGKNGWYVTRPVLTFKVDAGATLTLQDGTTPVSLSAPQLAGEFDVYTYTVPDGQHSYSYTAIKGTSLPASATLPVVKVDTVKPQAPVLTSAITATKVSEVTLNASWLAADGVAEIELLSQGRFLSRHAVTGSGAALANVPLAEGINNFTAVAYDAAGNASPASAAVSITRDTTAPTFDITVDAQNRTITITPSEPLAATPALAVRATADETQLALQMIATPGGIYKYGWSGTVANEATVNVNVTGSDLSGNSGTGHWVSTRLIPSKGGPVASGTVKAEFPPGALADGLVLMSTYSAGRLAGSAYVPPGTQLMGVYEFDANLLPGAKVDISFELEFTGALPPSVGVYHLNVGNPNAAPTYVPGTMTVLSTRTETDAATGNPITVYKVRVDAQLPHFSVWAPFVDMTAPEFTADVLVGGAAAAGQALKTTTVAVTGSVDGTARTVEAIVGGTTVASQNLGALTPADKSFSLSVPLGADGPKTITVKVTDEYGNWRDMDLNVVLDTQAPAVSGLTVGSTAYASGTTAATAGASIRLSGTTEAGARLTVTDGASTVLVNAALGSFDVNLNLAVGDNTYTVVATDPAGNQSLPVLVIIRRDNTAPAVTLTGINPVTPLYAMSIGYTVDEEVKTVVLSLDKPGATVGGSATKTYTTQAESGIPLVFPGNDSYVLTLTATDLAGNVKTMTQQITVDNKAPQVSLAVSKNPTNGGATLTVTGTIGGAPAANRTITIWLRGTIVTQADETTAADGTFTYTFAPGALNEGANDVVASLVGANAVSGSAATVITKDTAVPTATGLMAVPPRTKSQAAVSYSLTEAATANFQYSADGGNTWATAESVSLPAGSGARAITLPADGTYQFRLTLTDAAGNTQTLPYVGTVTRDATSPVITTTGLPAATTVRDLSIGYSVNESIQSVTLSVSGGASFGTSALTDQAKDGIDLHFPADGTYTVTITATDLVGNTASVQRTTVVDTRLPVVTAAVSQPLTKTASTLTVNAQVGGTAIANDATVALKRNGQAVTLSNNNPTGGTFTHTFTAAALDEGDNVIEVTVTRSNGLSSSTTTLITKDTTPPDATGLAPSAEVVTTGAVTLKFTLTESAKVVIERRSGNGAWEQVYTSGGAFVPAGAKTQDVPLPEIGIFGFRITVTDLIGFTTTRQFPSVERKEPPANQPPVVSVNAAETLTRKDSVSLSGIASADSRVTISIGDRELTSLLVGGSGIFQYEAALAEGANTFTVTVSRQGLTSTASVTVTRDTTAPALSVTAEHPSETAAAATLVIATEPGARVQLNGQSVSLQPDGTARVPVQLEVGRNEFTVSATDALENGITRGVTVNRAEPGPDPDPGPGPAPCNTAAGQHLTDITGHWAEEAIRCLVDRKVVTGFPDNTFRPDATVSRAQFMVMLGRALGIQPDANPVLDFTDATDIPAYAQGYISALVKEGLVRGDAQGTFRPEAEISRAELAVLMARVLAYKGIEVEAGEVQFTDQDQIPAWALAGLEDAVAAGLLNGFEDGSFQPGASATRGQSAALIRRLQVKLSEQ